MTRSKHRPTRSRRSAPLATHQGLALEQAAVQPLPPLTRAAAAAGILLLIGSVVLAYIPVMQAGYIRFDDTDYIEENHLLRTTHGLQQIWTSPQAYPPGVQFYPVTFTFHWLEYRLWGANPVGYHLVNVGLHAVNAVLVWLLLRRLHICGALFGALLFAVHPVQVQSVAWLAEGKNLLSMLFYLLTALTWLRFARTGFRPLYGVVLVAFLAALLSKAAVCTFPVALLLWIWWRRPWPWKKYVLLVVPLFCLAVVPAAVALWRENTLLEGRSFASGFSPIDRLLIAGRGLWFYVGKLLLPIKLVPIYPHWSVDAREIAQYVFPLAAVGTAVAAWLFRHRVGRAPLVVVLFFAVGLAPTSGLLDFGYMAKSFVADHYLYLPSLAVFAGLGALGGKLAGDSGRPGRYGTPVLAGMVALILGTLTWRQCGVYHDAESFWSDVVAHNPSPTALSSLGDVYLLKKDLTRAEDLLRKALAQRDSARARFRLGCVLIEREQFAAAAEQFRQGLRLNRTQDRIRGMDARLFFNLGYCCFYSGEYTRAAEAFRQASEQDPSFTAAQEWLATVENTLRNRRATSTSAPRPP
jgi:protein O-mannosyl-transferase